MLIFLLGLLEFFSGSALSVLAPFYTTEAQKHGLSGNTKSFIYNMYKDYNKVFPLQILQMSKNLKFNLYYLSLGRCYFGVYFYLFISPYILVKGSSIVFASVFLLQIICTPVFGRYISTFGSTRLLLLGRHLFS